MIQAAARYAAAPLQVPKTERRQRKKLKKTLALILGLTLTAGLLSGCVGTRETTTDTEGDSSAETSGGVVNVYNWGEYIDESVLTDFEEATGIKVNYQMYDSNETMYSKVAAGGAEYDVVIPSDYMIARMIEEDMLEPLNFDNIPNFADIDPELKNPEYDPENLYSVPYMWGLMGVIYNTTMVDEADLGSWDLLWNEKYSGKILMFGNSRDAFGIAEYLLGYDVNTTDDGELQAAAQKLKEQKPLVQQYVMDEIFDLMENEEAWIAPYYAGDFLTMAEENENLAFYHPSQGFNLFIDAMCTPSCCQNKEAAETFINFLCKPEIAGGNMDYLGYGTPETAAKEFMDPEVVASEVAYPSEETLSKGTSFLFLPASVNQRMEELWLQAKTD